MVDAMAGRSGRQNHGTASYYNNNNNKSFLVFIDIGLSVLDKLQLAIDDTTTLTDLKCNIECLSGIPSDLFELVHDGIILTGSLSPLVVESEVTGLVELKMRILPVWERFISACLKQENSQVRARIRVKMHGVTKDERIFVACFVAARQANSCLLFGLLPSNKMITRTVRLSKRNILHSAVIGGNRNCIANVLMHGGGKLITIEDAYGQTPMSIAKTLSKEGIVDMLEAYQMVSLRGESFMKGANDDDSGYECIISSQSLEYSKDSIEQDSEDDYELSSEEEENETKELSSAEQDVHCMPESPSVSTRSRHFLDGIAGQDETASKSKPSDVTERLLIEQNEYDKENGSEGCKDKTYNQESAIKAAVGINIRPERNFEEKHLASQNKGEQLLQIAFLKKPDSRKNTNNVIRTDIVGLVSETKEKEEILNDIQCMNNSNRTSLTKEPEEGPPSSWLSENNSTKINPKINESRREDVTMETDKGLKTNDFEHSNETGNYTLNGEKNVNNETQQNAAVFNGDEQPRDTSDTGSLVVRDHILSATSDGNLLPRRRKKGMPSLIISRTSDGSSSSFETLDLLDSEGNNFDSVSNSQDDLRRNSSGENQVCAPPIIKQPLVPKPPSSPVPINKNRDQTRRKFSIGSPTSGSPKSYSKSDMQSYLDEAWRRASDSDVNESLPAPPSRPRSYSTPHPIPDPREQTKSLTSSASNQTHNSRETFLEPKSLNHSATNCPNRRQSVGTWARRVSVTITFDEWLEGKKEQHRRNSLVVQKEKERRLSLGNQPTGFRFSKNINYEQWLAMKASEPGKKASENVTNGCHSNQRPREESAKAFRTWLQKKDDEALEREQRLLDEAISKRTRDTKREELLTQLILKMENKKKYGDKSTS